MVPPITCNTRGCLWLGMYSTCKDKYITCNNSNMSVTYENRNRSRQCAVARLALYQLFLPSPLPTSLLLTLTFSSSQEIHCVQYWVSWTIGFSCICSCHQVTDVLQLPSGDLLAVLQLPLVDCCAAAAFR